MLQSDQEILTLMIFDNVFRLFGRISQESSTDFKSKGFSKTPLVTSKYKKRSTSDSLIVNSSLFPNYISLFNFDLKNNSKDSTILSTINKESSTSSRQTLCDMSDFYETLCDIDMIEKDNYNDNNLHDLTAAMAVHSLYYNRKKKHEYMQNPWIEFTDFFNQRNKLQSNIQKFSNHMEIEQPNESQRRFYLRNHMELMDQMFFIDKSTKKSKSPSPKSNQLKKQKQKM